MKLSEELREAAMGVGGGAVSHLIIVASDRAEELERAYHLACVALSVVCLTILFTLVLLVRAFGAAADMPADPVQRVATKALAGAYGELEDWQHKAYTYALAQNAQISGVAWLTHYTHWEGFYRGKAVRWGQGCSERVAAAIMIDRAWYKGLPVDKRDRPGLDLSRQVWTGDYILTKLPTGWQMRQVLDTGAMSNLPIARRKGCEIWIDHWTDDEALRMKSWHCPFAVIRAYRTW